MALRVKLSGGAAAFVLLLATASLLAAPAHGMQYKCSACKAVGRELYRRLSEEDLSDKKDLDLRYGLDPHGKRKGRMLPYKESELRATELLDKLCDDMKKYGIATSASSKEPGWLQIQGEQKQTIHMNLGGGNLGELMGDNFGDKFETDGKRIQGYCGTIMEEREELLIAALMEGKVDVDKDKDALAEIITDVLCKWEKRKKKSPCTADDEGKIEL